MDGRRFASFQFREKISRLTKPKLVGWATLKPRSSHVEVDRAQEETMTTRNRMHGKRMPFDTLSCLKPRLSTRLSAKIEFHVHSRYKYIIERMRAWYLIEMNERLYPIQKPTRGPTKLSFASLQGWCKCTSNGCTDPLSIGYVDRN